MDLDKTFPSKEEALQYVHDCLNEEDLKYSASLKEDGSVERLFFVHNNSVKLCQQWNTVFVMDCTYKTNMFGMPLLNNLAIMREYATLHVEIVENLHILRSIVMRPK
jgi:hypothetical protein